METRRIGVVVPVVVEDDSTDRRVFTPWPLLTGTGDDAELREFDSANCTWPSVVTENLEMSGMKICSQWPSHTCHGILGVEDSWNSRIVTELSLPANAGEAEWRKSGLRVARADDTDEHKPPDHHRRRQESSSKSPDDITTFPV